MWRTIFLGIVVVMTGCVENAGDAPDGRAATAPGVSEGLPELVTQERPPSPSPFVVPTAPAADNATAPACPAPPPRTFDSEMRPPIEAVLVSGVREAEPNWTYGVDLPVGERDCLVYWIEGPSGNGSFDVSILVELPASLRLISGNLSYEGPVENPGYAHTVVVEAVQAADEAYVRGFLEGKVTSVLLYHSSEGPKGSATCPATAPEMPPRGPGLYPAFVAYLLSGVRQSEPNWTYDARLPLHGQDCIIYWVEFPGGNASVDVAVRVELPPGLELVSGNTTYRGPVNEPGFGLRFVVQATETLREARVRGFLDADQMDEEMTSYLIYNAPENSPSSSG